MRFYDPDFGQVLVDGLDVRCYRLDQLRGRMGLVMQEPTLFNYSVRENILYGNLKASNMQIKEAVDIATHPSSSRARPFKNNLTIVHPPYETRLFLKPTKTV
jgi:ABC-type multidrug transport system fused ATPase/permease subunit